jgi:hypothetical protein
MIQEAGIPESQAMLISGHEKRSALERYNLVSLKNVQDAGWKLDAWSKDRTGAKLLLARDRSAPRLADMLPVKIGTPFSAACVVMSLLFLLVAEVGVVRLTMLWAP